MPSRGLLIPMPTTLIRATVLLLAGGAVLLAANTITPRGSEAHTIDPSQMPDLAGERSTAMTLPAYMGTLRGTQYEIDVYMGRKGPEFTVKDLTGKELARGLSADELQAQFPTVDPATLNAGATSAYVEAPAETELQPQDAPLEQEQPLEPSEPAESPDDDNASPAEHAPQR